MATELRNARDHFHVKERCLYCDVIAQEIENGSRIVALNEHFVAFCPYASRGPFEVHIFPRRHMHDYRRADRELLRHLAVTLKDILSRLSIALDDPPYNLLINTAPNAESGFNRVGYWQTIEFDFHWHIEIFPRLTRIAGFEWGTGFFINPTAPEAAAEFLRNVEL